MAIDPICKMEVDEDKAEWTSEYEGKTYYFCAPGCKAAFEENPEKYLGEGSGQAEAEMHGMHESHPSHGHHDHHHGHGGHGHSQSTAKKPWWKFW